VTDSTEKNYKDTLNLPKTRFGMKAALAQREPQWLKQWHKERLYERLMAHSEGRPRFVLHDGPPYANGSIHMGHAVNKVLKDIIIKSKLLSGYQAPYVPGWDCHGLSAPGRHWRLGQPLPDQGFPVRSRHGARAVPNH